MSGPMGPPPGTAYTAFSGPIRSPYGFEQDDVSWARRGKLRNFEIYFGMMLRMLIHNVPLHVGLFLAGCVSVDIF